MACEAERWPDEMKRIFNYLYNTDQTLLNYAWKAAQISLIPALFIGFIISTVFPSEPFLSEEPHILTAFSTLVFAPCLETLLMVPILWILKRLFHNNYQIAFGSALIWGIIHFLVNDRSNQALTIIWSFFIFSICFLAWERESRNKAIIVTALVHMFYNIVPTIAILYNL